MVEFLPPPSKWPVVTIREGHLWKCWLVSFSLGAVSNDRKNENIKVDGADYGVPCLGDFRGWSRVLSSGPSLPAFLHSYSLYFLFGVTESFNPLVTPSSHLEAFVPFPMQPLLYLFQSAHTVRVTSCPSFCYPWASLTSAASQLHLNP